VGDVARELEQCIRQQRPGYLRGALLPTFSELAEEFGTSRRTMKLALGLAVDAGMVTLSLHGPQVSECRPALVGSGVASQVPREFRREEVLEFLKAVEPQVAAQAALNAAKNSVGRKALEAVGRRLEEHWNNTSPDVAMEDDREFHVTVAGLCANNKFYSSIRDCYARIEKPLRGMARPNNINAIGPSPVLLCMHAWYRDETREQHLKIFRAIMAGQCERARAAMEEHIYYVVEKFKEMKRDTDRGY